MLLTQQLRAQSQAMLHTLPRFWAQLFVAAAILTSVL